MCIRDSYRNKEFTSAAKNFRMNETSWGKYNLGNALAKSGNFLEAISAYEESLKINPDNADALYNKKIIEQLIENQSKPEKNNSGSENKDGQQSQQDRGNDSSEGEEKISNNQQNDGEISPEVNRNQSENDTTSDKEKSSYEGEDLKQTKSEEIEKEENSQSTALAREEEQALEQWLRRVPDDPGGLLRNKFKLQFEERIRKGEESGHDGTNDW